MNHHPSRGFGRDLGLYGGLGIHMMTMQPGQCNDGDDDDDDDNIYN